MAALKNDMRICGFGEKIPAIIGIADLGLLVARKTW